MANERRLIDANNLREGWLLYGANENIYSTNDILDSIDEEPTVDAVEVVRCKDCKYWGQDVCSISGDDESFCTNPNGLDDFAHPNDFCSYGEKREVE